MKGLKLAVAGAVSMLALAGCELPFDLGKPTTRVLESGATDAMGPTASFSLRGTYAAENAAWTISMSFARPGRQHLIATGKPGQVEAIVDGGQAYFRGQQFLASHMGSDPQSQALVRAAGNAWWKASVSLLPSIPDLTTGAGLRATFLGAAVTQRMDDVPIDGVLTAELSGPRGAVYIAEANPHRLVHLRMKAGAAIDSLLGADFAYDFTTPVLITPPTDVIDFSNLTTLPPIYTVLTVDTSRCSSTCVVSATLKNLGGTLGAKAPSTVTFTLASGHAVIASCTAQVTPDVAYNATTTVSCTIVYSGQLDTAAYVTATADNPGRA